MKHDKNKNHPFDFNVLTRNDAAISVTSYRHDVNKQHN